MQAGEAAVIALEAHGVTEMFGVIGDGNFRFAFEAEKRGLTYHPANHEAAAVAMADAWTRITGKVGVVTVTKGPGLTNTLTALTEAVKAHSPMLVLTGDAPRTASVGSQMIDHTRMVESVGAGVQRFRTPELVRSDVQLALERAAAERRPIVLSVPVDAQAVDVGSAPHSPHTPITTPPRAGAPTPSEVRAVVEAIARSERPVVLAGWGAHVSGAEPALTELARRTGALLTTTAFVKGMFADDPFCVGVSGGFSSDTAAELLLQADLVVAFGASLNSHTTRHGALYQDITVVQVEDRADQANVHFTPTTTVLADAAATARALLDALDDACTSRERFRTEGIAAQIAAGHLGGIEYTQSAEGTVHPAAVMAELNRSLPARSTVVTDGGQFFGFPASYIDTRKAGRFIFPAAFQAMGLGLGFAAGISVARGREDVTVAVIGDGGMRMSLGEVDALVRLNRPVLVVVLNDSAYGAEVHIMGHQNLSDSIALFPDCDFADVCRALGTDGGTVRSIDDLQTVRAWLDDPRGVFVLDCKTDRTIPAPFIPGLLGTLRA